MGDYRSVKARDLPFGEAALAAVRRVDWNRARVLPRSEVVGSWSYRVAWG